MTVRSSGITCSMASHAAWHHTQHGSMRAPSARPSHACVLQHRCCEQEHRARAAVPVSPGALLCYSTDAMSAPWHAPCQHLGMHSRMRRGGQSKRTSGTGSAACLAFMTGVGHHVEWHVLALLTTHTYPACLPSSGEITFYGGSFIADPTGAVVAQVGARPVHLMGEFAGSIDPKPSPVQGFVVAQFDLHAVQRQRLGWGMFRDRRPELYGAINSLDGSHRHAAASQ